MQALPCCRPGGLFTAQLTAEAPALALMVQLLTKRAAPCTLCRMQGRLWWQVPECVAMGMQRGIKGGGDQSNGAQGDGREAAGGWWPLRASPSAAQFLMLGTLSASCGLGYWVEAFRSASNSIA